MTCLVWNYQKVTDTLKPDGANTETLWLQQLGGRYLVSVSVYIEFAFFLCLGTYRPENSN